MPQWQQPPALMPSYPYQYSTVDQIWIIDDLKGMSDSKSLTYNTAIRAGLPDGIVRGFREELRVFKPHWQQMQDSDESSRDFQSGVNNR